MSLRVQRVHPEAKVPARRSEEAAGFLLSACTECVVHVGNRTRVPIGVRVKIPEGCYGRIASLTGLTIKLGVEVGAGVIDRDFDGELSVVLFNHGNRPFYVKQGYGVAQLILERYEPCGVEEDPDLFPADTAPRDSPPSSETTEEPTSKEDARRPKARKGAAAGTP